MNSKLSLCLEQSAGSLRLALDKAGVVANVKAETAAIIDVSGSFEHEHKEGTTSILIERLVPFCMVLDPDRRMDVFTFSSGERNAQYVGAVTPDDARDYVTRNIVDRVPGWNGGTTYSFVLERTLEHFGWKVCEEAHRSSQGKGFLGRLFGWSPSGHVHDIPHTHEKRRSLVLFITDGENEGSDEARTIRVLEESQRRGDQVYFLFIGACEDKGVTFEFVRKIARRFKNTGVVIIRDLEAFVAQSDEELNSALLGAELVEWLKS
ncbi:VWA domain-containing protein [Variovorax sp. LT1P1]|uniref:VWA domain-containing protein n=1 Tax=Variovorax sp. LT1P1 TaxID=3443730 RepID=UPI003F4821BA